MTFALQSALNSLRLRANLSGAKVHQGMIRRGLSLNGSTVSRWFVQRPDACTPSPGQLHILLDVLGATDADRIDVLRIAGEAAIQAEAAAA